MKTLRHLLRLSYLVAVALILTTMVACEFEATAQAEGAAPGAAQLTIETHDEYGAFLTDAEGRALYMFKADSQGETTCYDACAEAWPPLTTRGEPVAADPNVQEDLIGTIERTDGTTQVTYDGWPLYYYVRDTGPGDVEGQDVMGFGAEWYLVSPQGKVIEGEHEEHGGTESES